MALDSETLNTDSAIKVKPWITPMKPGEEGTIVPKLTTQSAKKPTKKEFTSRSNASIATTNIKPSRNQILQLNNKMKHELRFRVMNSIAEKNLIPKFRVHTANLLSEVIDHKIFLPKNLTITKKEIPIKKI